MPYFSVQYTYADAPVDLERYRPEHRAFLRGLLAERTLLAAGAFTDEPAGALLLLRAENADAVDAILQDDPFRLHGLISGRTIRAWSAAIGPWAG